jgi:hypothetical protein
VFRFLLKPEDGEPNDPTVFVSAVPNYSVGEPFLLGGGDRLLILAIDIDIDDERGFNPCSPSSAPASTVASA